ILCPYIVRCPTLPAHPQSISPEQVWQEVLNILTGTNSPPRPTTQIQPPVGPMRAHHRLHHSPRPAPKGVGNTSEALMEFSLLAAGVDAAGGLVTVALSRWQCGITTAYHFIFVPLTIELAPLVALMQTFWAVTIMHHWYSVTRIIGAVLLVNFAMGVATGIVQEFQFGMNWSEYSRMVGDVFGGPLALEGLVAFFMESVFLGIWIFGWGRIPTWLHTLAIWAVALAVNLSAYFIIVANSFMQHPVGAEFNPETGRAELTDIVALLTNPTAL